MKQCKNIQVYKSERYTYNKINECVIKKDIVLDFFNDIVGNMTQLVLNTKYENQVFSTSFY
ncbi:hypothetical protein A0H76_2837 [Hepatospora eriocheir]|uniref:Uncharacterized protein n=1 Tax=Hepatospora eriocheir TaxID=1081669 RepID=A0A1X0Q5J4_9MICR|nr:hypothetical protein A0H76_2837 [Hepatospora eriocheir]